MEIQALADQYRGKTDDELLALTIDQSQLTSDANSILEAELARRQINLREAPRAPDNAKMESLDDVPSIARVGARQELCRKWGRPIAIAPFVVVVFIGLKFFPNSTSRIGDFIIFASLAWSIAVVGYYFFLMFSVRCPACGRRFGMADKCMSCGLPRHRPAA